MADHNININLKDLSKASAAGPKPAGRETKVQMDPASLQKLNRVFKDAVSKSFNAQKLGDVIAGAISKKMAATMPKQGIGVNKADLNRTVKQISNDLAKKISQSLVSALSKPAAPTAPGRSDKRIVDALSNVDKHIKGSIDGLNTQLQKQFGKQLGSENAKTIASAVSGAVEKSIPKSLGKATQDLSRAVSSIQSIMREISGVAMSLRKMRKTGGGIDITEIKPIINNLKKLTSEFKKLPTEIRQARESAKSIAKEEKELYTNFSKALTDLRKSARERVTRATTRAKEDPQKFARIIAKELSKAISAVPAMRGTKIEKALAGLDKKIETVGDITGAVKGLEKEIRNQVQSGKVSSEGAKSLVKAVDTLNTNLKGLPKAMGGGESDKVLRRLEKFTERTGTLLKTVKVVLDEKEISKQVESAVKKAQPKIEIDASLKKGNLEKELTKLFSDISKKVKTLGFEPEMDVAGQLEKFKKSLAGGKAGEIRGAIFDLKKMPELKEFSDALQKAAESVAYLDSLKEAGSAAKIFTSEIGKATKTLGAIKGAPARMQMGPIRTARAALKTYEKYEYPAEVIPPTGKLELPPGKEKLRLGETAKKSVEENVKSLAKSLEGLQKFMVKRLEKELAESGRGWGIVRESSEQAMDKYFKLATGGMTGNIKQAGKQWTIQIADIARMGKTLGGVFDPTKMVEAYKETLVEKTVVATKPKARPLKIAKWIKLTADENIRSMDELTDVQKETFIKLKKESKGPEVAAEMESAVKSLLSTEKEIERVFRRTSAAVEAQRIMTEGILEKDKTKKRVYEEPPVLRKLAIPAAKLTGTGAAAFETAAGSMRALPKFATFVTGFERIYDMLLESKRLRPGETFGGRIREVGPRPTGPAMLGAEKLAKEMIKELSTVKEKRGLILEQYQRAAVPRGLELEKAGVGTIQQLEKQVEDAIGTFRKLPEAERNIDTFMDAMNKVGISAYDVVKSLDELRFENVYDVFQKILAKPIKGVAEAPVWGKPMRQFEETIRQMQQLLPIIEPGRPRRGPHMEAVAQLMTRTTPVYKKTELRMSEQKDLIKDLNLRLGELVSEAKALRGKEGEGIAKRLAQLKIPEAIREMSTLGVPEALAGRVQELRPGKTRGMEKLEDLGATTLKMYTENLRELAPFGAQFQNWARNITNVSNAMSSASDETIASLNKFGAAVEGTGTEFPTLRTEREREFISGGRFGKQGYGFNVLAELRTTAGTFEDQVLISGKIADALTSITKTLIRPGVAGRLKEFRETTAAGVTEIDPKLLRDVSKSVSGVSDKIQDVLGMPERYKGKADRALIDSVSKAITVVRGREVEVQAAKLAEVFLNYFGRKVTTRYGQKGVGVTPVPTNIREVLQYYGEKETKVLPKAERTRAGLGVAVMPKTMGQIASEILEKEAEKLESAGMAPAQIKRLSTSLVNSGNRFMLDMFKQAGVLAEDEIKVEKTLFTNLREALKKLDIDLASDIKGIGGLKEVYKERVGKPVFEERPIDIRISAAGVGKRGLQTEVLESVMANVMGLRPETKRPATMKTTLKPEMYEKMLAGKGKLEPGMLSKYAKALGFEPAMAGKREDVYRQLVDEFTKTFGKGKEEIAKRAAELETLSNFYVEVIDELSRGKGAPRKGLVGPKFAQIVEEPTLHADWTKTEIEKGIRGEKLNLPAFGAYAAIFGEQSEFMKELKQSMTVDSREAWEYLKALQVVNKQGDEFKKLLMKPLKTVDLLNIEDFTEATGTLEDFKGTILDIQKFPGPFKTKIPATEKGKAGGYEELYVPGPLARGTYEESLIAGERAPKLVARRLAHLISMAKKVEQERTGFAEIEKEIGAVEAVLAKTEDPTEMDTLNDKLVALNKQLEGLYADPKNVGVIKSKIAKTVGNMVKKVNQLAAAGTGEPEIVDIINTLMGALSETVGPGPGLRTRGVGAELPEITHAQKFMEEQLRIKESPFEAYAATAGRLSDMLISVSEKSKLYLAHLEETLGDIERGQTTKRVETFAKGRGLAAGAPEVEKTLRTFIKTHQDRMKSVSVLERSTAGGGLATLAAKLGVTIEKADSDYEKALAALARAKIDYYNTLAETALGKKGAVAEVLFSRTIPAVMGKAVAATVDKTDDLQRFTKDLGNIYAQFADLGKEFKLEELAEVSEKILKLREEHAKNVEKYKELGLPVLKQYELGVPPEMAKKIPVKYTPKYRAKGKGIEEIPEAMQKEVQSTLFDILEEAETLTKGGFTAKPGGPKPPSRRELQDYVEKQLVPYIESVRYPFTGISSVQPYKAKLMRGELAKTAMAVPGMPEMDIEEFDKLIEKVKDIRKVFEDAREGLQDIPADIEKRKTLTEVIDELNRAISRVLPKYAAHEQKLDFDGDSIEIHSASTREAREEIKKHFESLGDDIDSTRAVFRDFFTYGARQIPTGKYPLAEMTQAFEKKFPAEKGFGFLRKPHLAKEEQYLKPAEALKILAERPGAAAPADVLKDIVQQMVRAPEEQKQALEAIDMSVNKEADALVRAVESLGGNIEKLVKEGIKTRSFEEKYKDAIEAQLYKIHTGPETESLYRLIRLVEMNIGFGGGQIRPGAPSRAMEPFKERWPRGAALGGKPEFEFQTMINELLRFGIQKGMDVKHAGEFPVAGEVVRELSKGEKAAENLFDRIIDKNEDAFKDLRDFAEQNEEAIRRRLGRLSTGEVRAEAAKLRKGRGMATEDIGEISREKVVKEIIDMAGFKGFLLELARQIREAAGTKPGEEADIRQAVIAKRQPLYMKRVWGAAPARELGKFKGEMPVPEFEFGGMTKTRQKQYIRKYKETQATAMNLAKELKTATETMGGGAYAEMVSSSIENIYEEQRQINEKLLSKLQEPAGFAANIPKTSLVERVLTRENIANITSGLIGDPRNIAPEFMKKMKDQLEEYSKLAGVSLLTKAEKFEIKQQSLEEFGKRVAGVLGVQGVPPEEIERYSFAWVEKAKAITQMDKIIDALKSKRYEASLVRTLLPSPEKLEKVAKEAIRTAPKPLMPTAEEREAIVRRYMPKAAARGETMAATKGAAARALLPRGAKDCVPITNCGKPLEVYIVGADDVLRFDVGQEKALTTALKQQMRDVGPASGLAKQAEALRGMAEQVTGKLNTLVGATYETVYRASGLKGAGMYERREKAFKPTGIDIEELKRSQMQSVMEQMLGLGKTTPALEASALLGTALHSKIEKELKKEHGEKIEFEKFVKYEDDILGTIGGHIDAALKDASGNIEKIIDVKTIGESVLKDIGPGVIDLDDAINKATNTYTKYKLEETASQINLYLAAVAKETGKKPEEIVGEARLYSRLAPEKEPAVVRVKFDPTRLQRDLEAVRKSRELIQKYIIEENPLELADIEYRKIVDTLKAKLAGKKPEFAPVASLKEMEEASKNIQEMTDKQITEFVRSATDYYLKIAGKKAATMPAKGAFTGRPFEAREKVRIEKQIREAAKSKMDIGSFEKAAEIAPAGDLESVFKALTALHTQAKNYQSMINKLDFETEFKGLNKAIQGALSDIKEKGRAGGAGARLADLMKDLQEEGAIGQAESSKVWKMYRMAVGDFYLREAAAAKKAMGDAGDDWVAANEAYAKFSGSIERFQEFVIESLPKRTGIYTAGQQYVSPELARGAGVYMEPKEIAKRAGGALGEDEQLRQLFKMVVETEKAPVFKAREVVSSLTNINDELVALLNNADLVKRKGGEFKDAWDFSELTEGATRLRSALQSYLRFNVREDFTVAQRKNLQDVLGYLKQIETGFSKFGKEAGAKWGETGAVKVMPWLDPKTQRALHMRNVAGIREYFKKAQAAGGPQVGERFTYLMKVLDQTGNIIKNTAVDFHKYGEFVDKAGMATGAFAEKQRDLMVFTQGANRTFRAALRRVTMWGAAASVVYGGMSQLKSMIGTIADIEMGIAQLRMVMSPLETDFDIMGKAAIGFAKQFGTPMKDVLQGMRIFAQQGLNMADVIDRTRTATLAANVTTLNAKDATQAITAASKVFRQEGESTLKFIDAWSEVEAKHAITSEDLALALRKAASAGKNAGFTFDELNGIIASIGAVTRQTGREVGTSLRFIFRRLASEKGPKELAKIGIPVMTETGELRRGFDILNDLAGAWKDLTSAQKMNISQSVGGTRQYNQVLVLMDNWDEATSALRDSINSTGSAQRRNQEVMKTYAKQLQQTKAAAVELQMSFGKAYLPIAKFGLKGLKFVLESLSAIPNSVKAVATALALLVTYIAKGDRLVGGFTKSLGKGSQFISEFFDAFKKGTGIAGFEIFGRGKGLEFEGLKKIGEGKSIRDFQSALGKSAYVMAEVGKSWNRLLGDIVIGGGKMAESVGDAFEGVGKGITALTPLGIKDIFKAPAKAGLTPENITKMIKTGGGKGVLQVAKASAGVAATITAAVAGQSAEIAGKAIDMFGEKMGGVGQKFLKQFASQNTGFVKAVAPMTLSLLALIPVFKSVIDYYGKTTKSAQDYEKSVYGLRRANESGLSTIRTLIKEYDTLNDRLEDLRKSAQPEVKARRMELGTYESPLMALADVQKDATDTSNLLAETNINLAAGYDNLGNAVLRTVGDFKEYLKALEKLKVKEMAKTEVDVLDKYIKDLTEIEGPEKWKSELKKLLKEAPVFGEIIGKHIKVSPAKALDEVTKRLNALIALKNKFPISTAFDKDIKKYQGVLKEVRRGFEVTYKDFRRVLSDVSTAGLDREEIAELFGRGELQKGFELMLQVEPRFRVVPDKEVEISDATWRDWTRTVKVKTGVKWQDILGAEVMRRAFPEKAPILDVTSMLTQARLETAGIKPRAGKALEGDIITFMDDVIHKYNIAGKQAILSFEKTTDGIFEAVITYFNTKTLKVEERPFTEEMTKLVDNVFPAKAMEEDLSERIEVFNEFVAGAAAGLRGMGPKEFKKGFGLGERFFADIPTTTIIQGGKGFTPGGGFGESPYQKEWKKTIDQFFFKPMTEYRMKAEQLEKLRIEGLEGEGLTLATGIYEELVKLQELLKNNQVVLQYRAVFADLTKTIEQSTRAMQENLAVEESRLELQKNIGGYLKGIPEGLEDINVGVQRFRDLTARQRALMERGAFQREAVRFRGGEIRRGAAFEQVSAVDRALVALESIRSVSEGFGAVLSPEDMKKYTEVVAKTGDTGTAEIVLETRKVESNTADTVERLDRILENLGDQTAMEDMLSSVSDFIGGGVRNQGRMVNALERVARIREGAMGEGNRELLIASNKSLDMLSKNLVQQVGIKKAMELVENNTTIFSKKFTPEELAQRAFGGMDFKVFADEVTKKIKGGVKWDWRSMDYVTKPAFADLKETKKLAELQKDSNKNQWVSSKSIIKTAAAVAAFEQFSKTSHNKTIKKLEEQVMSLDSQISEAKKEGKDIKKLSERREVLGQAVGTEKAKLEFDKMVQAVSAITAGSMMLAKSMGLSEGQIKALGGAAVGTYAAVKLVSTILGREMPESAKEFGAALKETGAKIAAGEKVGYLDSRKVKAAGKKFMGEYGSSIKVGAKQFGEEVKKAATSPEVKKAVGEKPITEVRDLKKEADKVRQEIGRTLTREEGTKRLRQIMATYAVYTAAGYVAGKTEEGTRLATLNKQAEEQAKVFADIVRQYPEAADDIIKEMSTKVEEAREVGKKITIPTEERALALDTEKERRKVVSDMEEIREKLVKEHEKITKEMEKSAEKLARMEIAEQFKMELEEMASSIESLKLADKFARRFEVETAGLLAGRRLPGGLERGIRRPEEMTPEQYMLYKGGKKLGKAIGAVGVLEEERAFKIKKVTDLEAERAALAERRGFFGGGLTAAEEERYDLLGDAVGDLTDEIEDLTDDITESKTKLEADYLKAQVELFEIGREREYKVARALEKVTREVTRGRGVLAGGRGIPQLQMEFGPRTIRELTGYQMAVRGARGRGDVGAVNILDAYEESLARQQELIEKIRGTQENISRYEGIEGMEGAVDAWQRSLEGARAELEGVNETFDATAETARTLIKIEEQRQRMLVAVSDTFRRIVQLDIESYFGNIPTVLNRALRGFPGEAALPPMAREMTPQQTLFTRGGPGFRTALRGYRAQTEMLRSLSTAIESETNVRMDELETILATTNSTEAAIKVIEESGNVYDANSETVERLIKSYDLLRDSAEETAKSIRNASDYMGVMKSAVERLMGIRVEEVVERLPGVRRAREMAERLYGGAHPMAAQAITVEQQRQGFMGGVPLEHMRSTRYQIRQAELMNRMLGDISGEEMQSVVQELVSMPEQRRRDIEAYNQTFENRRILRQKDAHQQTISDLERYKQNRNLSDSQISAVDGVIGAYDTAVGGMLTEISRDEKLRQLKGLMETTTDPAKLKSLEGEYETVSKAGAQQFRGIIGDARIDIESAEAKVLEEFGSSLDQILGEAPLRAAITDPIVSTIDTSNSLLMAIAESMGASIDLLKQTSLVPLKEVFGGGRPRALRPDVGTATFAPGGFIAGQGGPKDDQVPIMASPGEYVFREEAARKIGYANLEYMNKKGMLPGMQAGGRIPTISAEPEKSLMGKIGGALWEMMPFHQYMTKSGRKLAGGMPAEARAQQNFGEFAKLLDFMIGGESGFKVLGKEAVTSLSGFAKNLFRSQRGAVGPDINYGRKLMESAVFDIGGKRYRHPYASAILESPQAEKILSEIPKGTKILNLQGAQAVVLETPKGKVVRIGELLAERPKVPEMLQANKRKVFGHLQLEETQKVDTTKITNMDIETMKQTLSKRGLEFSDPTKGNLGRIGKKVVVIDPGAVRAKTEPTMKSFSKAFEGQDFDPDEAGRMLKSLLGEGMFVGGAVQRHANGGIIESMKGLWDKYTSDADVEKLPLGTGGLEQTSEKIKKRKEEMQRQLAEMGLAGGGVVPLESLTLEQAQERFKGDVNTWWNWKQARKALDRFNMRMKLGVVDPLSKPAIFEMRDQVENAGKLLSGVYKGDIRSIDKDIHKDFSKSKKMMQYYSGIYDTMYYKDLETIHGKNWFQKLAPNLVPSPDNLKKLLDSIKKSGNAVEFLPIPFTELKKLADGGYIKQSGPAFLHKGEVVLPEKFANGGTVEKLEYDKNVLNGPSLEINTDEIADRIEEAIKDAIESAEFPKLEITDDLPSLDVDVADKKVGVETTGVTIPLDATEATANLEVALRNANVGAGGAVGAERFDKVDLAVDTLTNRIFNLEDSVDRKIKQEIEMVGGSVVSKEVISEMIKVNVDPLLTEINRSDSTGDGYRRDIENLKEHMGTRIEMLEAQINRVSTHVGGS